METSIKYDNKTRHFFCFIKNHKYKYNNNILNDSMMKKTNSIILIVSIGKTIQMIKWLHQNTFFKKLYSEMDVDLFTGSIEPTIF